MVFHSAHEQRRGECALKDPSINNVTCYCGGIEGVGGKYLAGGRWHRAVGGCGRILVCLQEFHASPFTLRVLYKLKKVGFISRCNFRLVFVYAVSHQATVTSFSPLELRYNNRKWQGILGPTVCQELSCASGQKILFVCSLSNVSVLRIKICLTCGLWLGRLRTSFMSLFVQ